MELLFQRKCPRCAIEIFYKRKIYRDAANKAKSNCRKCDNELRKEYFKGEMNPFYGKIHTSTTKEKIAQKKKGKRCSIQSEFKKGQPTLNKKSLYEIWLSKYGSEVARKKLDDYKKKQSFLNKGYKNKMYGKPAPKGSGNGWSGWYKDWFFRSINELSYMVQVIERFNLRWESGEQNKYKIKYEGYSGETRNYFPDFIINGKYMIECKPKKLWNTVSVIKKMEAARKFCRKLNLKYKLIECSKLSLIRIRTLRECGLLKFTEKYEQKYKQYIDNSGRATSSR